MSMILIAELLGRYFFQKIGLFDIFKDQNEFNKNHNECVKIQ